jgi:hypothetical protein
MNPLMRTWLVLLLLLLLSGCYDSNHKQPTGKSEASTNEQACQILLDYADQYEQIYLKHDGEEMAKRLSEVEAEFHKRMSELAGEGKWAPLDKMGNAIKLSFLIGEFHGALQSCKVERAHKDGASLGCDEVKKKKDAMKELCSE